VNYGGITTIWYIIPAYMEEKRIGKTLEHLSILKDVLKKEGIKVIPVLVDDGSSDRTYDVMLKYVDVLESIALRIRHEGRGAALREGVKVVYKSVQTLISSDIIVFSSADLKLTSDDFLKARKLIFDDKYDVVLLSKNLKESYVRRPFIRRVLSLTFNLLIRFLFKLPYKDTQGVKFIKFNQKTSKILKDCTMKGFLYDTEIVIKLYKHHAKIKEIPWHLSDFSEKGSKINPYSILLMALELLHLLKRIKK